MKKITIPFSFIIPFMPDIIIFCLMVYLVDPNTEMGNIIFFLVILWSVFRIIERLITIILWHKRNKAFMEMAKRNNFEFEIILRPPYSYVTALHKSQELRKLHNADFSIQVIELTSYVSFLQWWIPSFLTGDRWTIIRKDSKEQVIKRQFLWQKLFASMTEIEKTL